MQKGGKMKDFFKKNKSLLSFIAIILVVKAFPMVVLGGPVIDVPDGDAVCSEIPEEIKNLLRIIVLVIQIGVPIILVVLGMVDLGKAVMQQKEDDIKEAQQLFIKRLIAAGLVFFIIVIIGFMLTILDMALGDRNAAILDCMQEIFHTWDLDGTD